MHLISPLGGKGNTLASTMVLKLKSHFARYGCPDKVISDNRPQFTSDTYQKFTSMWEFEHLTSSPSNPKANGKAESAVKTAKNLLRKALDSGSDPYMAILDHQNTQTQGLDSSPAQRLMKQCTKTILPTARSLQKPLVVHGAYQSCLSDGDVVRTKPFCLGDKEWRKVTITSRLDERSVRGTR